MMTEEQLSERPEPNFSLLKQLAVQSAFAKPDKLIEAVSAACPDPTYFNSSLFEYGRHFDDRITCFLEELALYSLEQNFEAYIEFETGLHKYAQPQMMAEIERVQNMLSSEGGLTAEDENIFSDLISDFQNSADAQRKQHIQSMYTFVIAAIRHSVSRVRPELRQSLELIAAQREKDSKKYEEAQQEQELLGKAEYDPEKERLDGLLEQAFEGVEESDFAETYHLVLLDVDFLMYGKKIGIFIDPPSDDFDIMKEGPVFRAMG